VVGVNGEEDNDRFLVSDCSCGLLVLFVDAELTTLWLIILTDERYPEGFDLVGLLPDNLT